MDVVCAIRNNLLQTSQSANFDKDTKQLLQIQVLIKDSTLEVVDEARKKKQTYDRDDKYPHSTSEHSVDRRPLHIHSKSEYQCTCCPLRKSIVTGRGMYSFVQIMNIIF